MNCVLCVCVCAYEALNKRATALYYCHKYERSWDDTVRVLQVEPRHFGALAGQGMILERWKEHSAAIKAFGEALEVHPWMDAAITRRQVARERLETERWRGAGWRGGPAF